MCRLFPCMSIFRGVFLLKSVKKKKKKCVHVIMLKIALLLVKNVCFALKKDISKFLHQIPAKHTAHVYIIFQTFCRLFVYFCDVSM